MVWLCQCGENKIIIKVQSLFYVSTLVCSILFCNSPKLCFVFYTGGLRVYFVPLDNNLTVALASQISQPAASCLLFSTWKPFYFKPHNDFLAVQFFWGLPIIRYHLEVKRWRGSIHTASEFTGRTICVISKPIGVSGTVHTGSNESVNPKENQKPFMATGTSIRRPNKLFITAAS